MPKTSIELQEEENVYFHMNYSYMWKKLNTTPYYVSGAGEIPKWIHEQWLLPSYANLSKCLSPSFVPSLNIVNKIIQFYNANIKPEVDTYAFLHEKLEEGDSARVATSAANAEPYCGLYYGYYYSGITNKKEIYGAVLKISRSHDSTAAQLITGITTDSDLHSDALKDLFSGKDVSLEHYMAYFDQLELVKRRTALYKGTVEITTGLLTLTLHCEDRSGSVVVLRMPSVESIGGEFFGSMGLLTLVSERDMQILKMGIIRADRKELKPFSLKDEQLADILSIQKLANEHIQLSFNDNTMWNDMILSTAE